MSEKSQEIISELKNILAGKTLDALLPPIFYAILNAIFGLQIAIAGAALLALVFFFSRIQKQQSWGYALGGLLGVLFAGALAFFTKQAKNYYLPGILGGAVLTLLTLLTLFLKQPLAAWSSHLTRGWPLAWYWRKDVYPAYNEVTIIWLLFFVGRLLLQFSLLNQAEVGTLAWTSALLGWPLTIAVLVLSYVYGLWRLRKLQGPSVDEHLKGSQPPYKGQTRGF